MIRVYFDWGVISDIRKFKTEKEPFNSIFNVINKARNRFLIPYSPAHLNDLRRSIKDTNVDSKYTYIELDFLKELTLDQCLFEDFRDDKVQSISKCPIEYFNENLSNSKSQSLEDFIQDGDKEISKLWSKLLDITKLIPTGINTNEFEKIPNKYNSIKLLFENTNSNNSFYSLLKDVSDILFNPAKHSKSFRVSKNYGIEYLKIKTNPEDWGDPYEYLNKVLIKAKFNQNIQELIDSSINSFSNGKPPTLLNIYTTNYIVLDSFGYYKDKELPNLIDDAMHSYYSANCDFFVTDDKNTYKKTLALFKKFNIKTKVCNSNDFLSILYETYFFDNDNSYKYITDRISDVLLNSELLLETQNNDNEFVSIYGIKFPILDHFNRFQITYSNDFDTVFFYRRIENYSNFLFWSEIESILKILSIELGIDSYNNLEFNDDDLEELKNKKPWKGRFWNYKNTKYELILNNEQCGLNFILYIPKPVSNS